MNIRPKWETINEKEIRPDNRSRLIKNEFNFFFFFDLRFEYFKSTVGILRHNKMCSALNYLRYFLL